jgi:rSAM/selenodomain-associated transferase 1
LPRNEEIAADLEGLEITFQCGDDLGERLVHAFQERLHRGARRVVVIGSDCPTMEPEYVEAAFEALRDHDLVFGPAEDGGYVLVGCSRLRIRPFQQIPWGTGEVLNVTRKKLRRLGIPHRLLRPAHDLDTRDDALRAYTELAHLEALGACRAPRTLALLREVVTAHPEWGVH